MLTYNEISDAVEKLLKESASSKEKLYKHKITVTIESEIEGLLESGTKIELLYFSKNSSPIDTPSKLSNISYETILVTKILEIDMENHQIIAGSLNEDFQLNLLYPSGSVVGNFNTELQEFTVSDIVE